MYNLNDMIYRRDSDLGGILKIALGLIFTSMNSTSGLKFEVTLPGASAWADDDVPVEDLTPEQLARHPQLYEMLVITESSDGGNVITSIDELCVVLWLGGMSVVDGMLVYAGDPVLALDAIDCSATTSQQDRNWLRAQTLYEVLLCTDISVDFLLRHCAGIRFMRTCIYLGMVFTDPRVKEFGSTEEHTSLNDYILDGWTSDFVKMDLCSKEAFTLGTYEELIETELSPLAIGADELRKAGIVLGTVICDTQE